MFNFNDYEMDYTLPLEYGIRLVEHDRSFDILEKYFILGQLINKADHLSLNLITLVTVLTSLQAVRFMLYGN